VSELNQLIRAVNREFIAADILDAKRQLAKASKALAAAERKRAQVEHAMVQLQGAAEKVYERMDDLQHAIGVLEILTADRAQL
jgi:hypothetical protein